MKCATPKMNFTEFRMPTDVRSSRRGVTLTEVLMSLMIMSIGVSAVAVLFPISVLRSVQATQLTNSAILKYNAEALLRMRSSMVFDPDGDGNLREHVGRAVESRYIIDPVGYYAMTEAGGSYMANPTWPGDPAQTRGFADWVGNIDDDNDPLTPPIGFVGLPRYDGGLRTGTRSGALPQGLRPDANTFPEENRSLQMLAATISKLGDGWTTVLDTYAEGFFLADGSNSAAPAGGAGVVGVVLPQDVDLSDILDSRSNVPVSGGVQLIADPETTRIVVFSIDGKSSISLPVTAVDNSTKGVLWSEDLNFNGTLDAGEDLSMNGSMDRRPLPLELIDFTMATPAFQVGRVVIQTNRTHDFNWLLTVRRSPDGEVRGVDVVVMFNKNVSPDEERLFPASFNPAVNPFRINVLQSGGFLANGDAAEPFIKRGGYMLDIENARWYRIRDYSAESAVTVGATTGPGFIVTVESPVIEASVSGMAMFLPGIVDVYPMGSMPLPNNL